MLLTTLLLSIELLGVEPKNISLLGMDFAHFSYPEYIKPILFTVFAFVLIGYIQRFFYEGWNLVKAGYQKSVNNSIDKICLKQLRELQRAEAKRIDNEHYFDTDMDDLLSMEAYIRPSLRELARSQFKMQGLMVSLVGKHCIEQNKISVRTITRIDVLWLKIRNILVTGCTRPESYTHIWPLIYASFVVVFYAKPLNW